MLSFLQTAFAVPGMILATKALLDQERGVKLFGREVIPMEQLEQEGYGSYKSLFTGKGEGSGHSREDSPD